MICAAHYVSKTVLCRSFFLSPTGWDMCDSSLARLALSIRRQRKQSKKPKIPIIWRSFTSYEALLNFEYLIPKFELAHFHTFWQAGERWWGQSSQLLPNHYEKLQPILAILTFWILLLSINGQAFYMDRIDQLRREIAQRESELADLRSQLALAESEHRTGQEHHQDAPWRWPLPKGDYERYSRQMIVPKFGLPGTYHPAGKTGETEHCMADSRGQHSSSSETQDSSSSAREDLDVPPRRTSQVRESGHWASWTAMLSRCRTCIARWLTLRVVWA